LFRCLIGARLAHEATGPSDSRLHQARQTYASFMIASGVNAKALCSYMGHSSIKVTFDLYGHLMPGAEAEAASLLDAFLIRADSEARKAAVG
jgi:integrase